MPVIEVLLSNGDRAEAVSCEDAAAAAATLFEDAAALSAFGTRGVTAAFYVDGRLVRDGVRREEVVRLS